MKVHFQVWPNFQQAFFAGDFQYAFKEQEIPGGKVGQTLKFTYKIAIFVLSQSRFLK